MRQFESQISLECALWWRRLTRRQNFLVHPFPWLENWCGGLFYALCITSEGNEIQPHMLCSSLHDEYTTYRLLSFAVYLLIDSSTSRLSLSIALVKCNNKLRTQILCNGYCQFWARFVESHKIVVFTKNNDLWSYDNNICRSKGFNNLINHVLFSIKFSFFDKKIGDLCVCVCVCVFCLGV